MQASTGVPTTLRTGRGHISASSEPQRKIGAATLVTGEAASPCTWRGLTRLALVEEPLHSEPAPLAETLALDARTPPLLQAGISWLSQDIASLALRAQWLGHHEC